MHDRSMQDKTGQDKTGQEMKAASDGNVGHETESPSSKIDDDPLAAATAAAAAAAASRIDRSDGSAKSPAKIPVEEIVRQRLSEPRMNCRISLPECPCLESPKVISYSEVGDPDGFAVILILGMDSHRYLSLLFDDNARARGLRVFALDRPGRGFSSDFQDSSVSRILQFPQVLRSFCTAKGIAHFALLGQSLGATYALRCAQVMQDMVATTVYLVSPWVPLSVPGSKRSLAFLDRLPSWVIKGGMSVGTAVPRFLASVGNLSLLTRGCSEAELKIMSSDFTREVLKAVLKLKEASNGVALDALAALEKEQPLGFDYRDVSMPVHVFHGRSDQLVPFAAAQWMAEEMPACTVSVKVGGTHGLMMDSSVMDCVLEFMCEDFKHFMAQAVDGKRGGASGTKAVNGVKGMAFSFPAHTQRFQAEGELFCRRGMLLLRGWELRFFILEGYQLYEFQGRVRATARRVVDLRGTTAHIPPRDHQHSAVDNLGAELFPFTLEDSSQRIIYELAASTAHERELWATTLAKASCFSKGSREQQRDGALSKRLLVTTRSEKRTELTDWRSMRKRIGRAAEQDVEAGGASRRRSLPAGGLKTTSTSMSGDTTFVSTPSASASASAWTSSWSSSSREVTSVGENRTPTSTLATPVASRDRISENTFHGTSRGLWGFISNNHVPTPHMGSKE